VKNLFHEPLFQFLLIGAALFPLSGLFGNSDQPQSGQTGQPSFKIIITPGQIEHLKAQFKRTWQRPPMAQELKKLIDNHVLDEISYREATARISARPCRSTTTIRRHSSSAGRSKGFMSATPADDRIASKMSPDETCHSLKPKPINQAHS
jgi:hypothetical protein